MMFFPFAQIYAQALPKKYVTQAQRKKDHIDKWVGQATRKHPENMSALEKQRLKRIHDGIYENFIKKRMKDYHVKRVVKQIRLRCRIKKSDYLQGALTTSETRDILRDHPGLVYEKHYVVVHRSRGGNHSVHILRKKIRENIYKGVRKKHLEKSIK